MASFLGYCQLRCCTVRKGGLYTPLVLCLAYHSYLPTYLPHTEMVALKIGRLEVLDRARATPYINLRILHELRPVIQRSFDDSPHAWMTRKIQSYIAWISA